MHGHVRTDVHGRNVLTSVHVRRNAALVNFLRQRQNVHDTGHVY